MIQNEILIVLFVAVAFLATAGIALAEQTGPAEWNNYSGIAWLDDAREDAFGQTHSYTDKYNDYKRNNPWGAGADVVLYEFEGPLQRIGFDAIEAQGRYDFANGEYQIYGVAKINAFRFAKKLLNW